MAGGVGHWRSDEAKAVHDGITADIAILKDDVTKVGIQDAGIVARLSKLQARADEFRARHFIFCGT